MSCLAGYLFVCARAGGFCGRPVCKENDASLAFFGGTANFYNSLHCGAHGKSHVPNDERGSNGMVQASRCAVSRCVASDRCA